MFALLSGKKTYVTGVMALLGAIAGILTGEMAVAEGINLGVTALLGIFIRNGMNS